MPPKKYKEQIAQIKAVVDEKRHSQLEKQWLDLKEVFDLIADQVETFPEHGDQHVSVDSRVLSEGMKSNLRKVLSNLASDTIAGSINDHPSGVMQTTTRYRKMLEGENIIFRSPKSFEKYRRDVVKVLEFIRADAATKFRKTQYVSDTTHALRRKKDVIELSFPEPVQWEKVTLKFMVGNRDIEIFYDNKLIKTADHVELGFYSGEKQQKPNRMWQFLIALSTLFMKNIVQATPDNLRIMFAPPKVSSENVQQIKRQLVKKLCDLFDTDADPFREYRGYYFPKFKILPEPELRTERPWSQGGRFNDQILYEDADNDHDEK